MPHPLWNIESLENLSQIVPKGHRSSESYATENTSRDKDGASVSKGVGSETQKRTSSNGNEVGVDGELEAENGIASSGYFAFNNFTEAIGSSKVNLADGSA